jgi:predicted phosphodiesterase
LDAYRFNLFPWLEKELDAEKAQTLIILGDVTDAKDRHPAELVNKIVRVIDSLRKHVPRIIILKGNHDLQKTGHTFFQFLDALPGVEVISKPTEDQDVAGEPTMFLPHSRNPAKDWAGFDFSHYKFLLLHQTIKGAKSSNGQEMDGESLPSLAGAGKVYSGDIHVPQIIGSVEYVGSPYAVHFGDAFDPRCVVIDRSGKAFDLRFPSPKRLMLDVDGDEGVRLLHQLKPDDQVKIRVHLHESEKHAWRKERDFWTNECTRLGLVLCGLEMKVKKTRTRVTVGDRPASDFDPKEAVHRFVAEDELGGELLDAALECIEDK